MKFSILPLLALLFSIARLSSALPPTQLLGRNVKVTPNWQNTGSNIYSDIPLRKVMARAMEARRASPPDTKPPDTESRTLGLLSATIGSSSPAPVLPPPPRPRQRPHDDVDDDRDEEPVPPPAGPGSAPLQFGPGPVILP
ncbi:hypothetical protein LshimejAT787_0400100 [Lyophyllum shimeji]|uniref:Uncharacterized protein n=1 Tax=Lyophyllum shimeji TaxID=47721 RepID=A0A9P3PK67_LYOSH|nr:hypothetical protein LshimejAT787_0400100 [Lyophyllum shimeji]